MTRVIPGSLLVGLAIVLTLPAAVAEQAQDPATYPSGVGEVRHSAVQPRSHFSVIVEVAGSADSVGVYVCTFASVDAPRPTLCYMPIEAQSATAAWTASTSDVAHPEWSGGRPDWGDGDVLGYKVLVRSAGADLHAPDRRSEGGEYDYYRVVVGAPDESHVEGSALVEDTPAGASAPAARPGGDQGGGVRLSPGCGPACILLLAALALARRRPS